MQIVISEKTTVTKNIFFGYCFILFTRMLLLIQYSLYSSVNRIERQGRAELSKNVLSLYELRRDRPTSTRNDLRSV